MTTKTKEKISIPAKANVRVIWEDVPENYTKDRVKRIEQYIAEKYSVSRFKLFLNLKNKIQNMVRLRCLSLIT